MATCYFVCDENTPGAEKFRVWSDKRNEDIWLAQRECLEPLCSELAGEVSCWKIEEIYTEDDDHGDAFRYFDRNEITNNVTLENAIVKDGAFAGALYKNKVNGTLTPVLIGEDNVVRESERLSETHDLEKQSDGHLARSSEN